MPLFDRAYLEKKIADAQASRQVHMGQVTAHDGLIQAYQEMLSELTAEESAPPADA